MVPPPRSHCRIDSSEQCHGAHHPCRQHRRRQSGRWEGVKQDTSTVRCALLATPPRPRTCSSLPAVPCSLRPLGWVDFLQQKEQAPWTPDYPSVFARGSREPQSPGEALKPLQLGPALGAQGYQWEKAASSCVNCPAVAVLVLLQLCPLYRATEVRRGLLPPSIPYPIPPLPANKPLTLALMNPQSRQGSRQK